ncbi:MAG: serpin family protein [Planctomycetes bacterium]|nr:serpin family protein [Planctomycetota bacterium]
MKTIKYAIILSLVITATAGGFSAAKPAEQRKPNTELITQANNKFATDLYAKLSTTKGNLFFSPYSISTALAMTYAGAKNDTAAQMAEALNFPTEPAMTKEQFHYNFGAVIKNLNSQGEKGNYDLTIANALWGQAGYGFLDEYLELVKTNYDSQLNKVDFIKNTEAARLTINKWVEDKTNDKIKNLLQKGVLNNLTRLVLTNAIYFKGNWADQFKTERTKDQPFTLITGDKIDVPMMNRTEKFSYTEADSLQVLELPYVEDELSMIILLPKKDSSLAELENGLTSENLSTWMKQLIKREVIVAVPKFKMESKFDLVPVLKSMGMKNAFTGKADFSGMNGRKDLAISAVVHKAYVDVNEEGTEAAAATGITMSLTSAVPEAIPVFRADRPFVFLIRDNGTGSILFLGRVMNPVE